MTNPLYTASQILSHKRLRQKQKKPFSILFTDIDDTFLRKDEKLATKKLAEYIEESGHCLVAVTGSRPERILRLSKKGILPKFSLIIGAVGTEIIFLQKDGVSYTTDSVYEKIVASHKFHREQVAAKVRALMFDLNQSNAALRFVFQKIPPETYKVSCNFFADSEKILSHIRHVFTHQFPQEKIIICRADNLDFTKKPVKYCLDIVSVSKSDAIGYVMKSVEPDSVIVAGDSGNDADMLIKNGTIAIITGGAKPELLKEVEAKLLPVILKKSVTKVRLGDGSEKIYYKELSDRVGPESILYALHILKI